jgi:hypothetical protein
MQIGIKILNKCPALTHEQRELIERVDINHETLSSIAKSVGKTPSTICTQHKKALEKFTGWMRDMEKHEAPAKVDLSKLAFRMYRKGKLPNYLIATHGRPNEFISLWKQYRELEEDDFYQVQSKLAEIGLEPSKDSDYPLSDQLDNLIYERNWYVDEDEKAREVLDEYGVKGGTISGGYGSLSEGVQRLGDELLKTRTALISANQQKEDLRELLEEKDKQLEETMDKLSNTEKTLDNERLKVKKLLRLEKYERISDEERKSLELEIEVAQKLIASLNKKVEELQLSKANLEKEVNWLKQNKEGAINTLMQVKANVKKDIADSVLETLGNLQYSDVLKLYITALKRKLYKTAVAP